MRVDLFDFDLPERLIALRPARPRRAARLLVAEGAQSRVETVADLPSLLRAGDMLVFNDTRVIPARLFGERRRPSKDGSGVARIEATLLRETGPGCWEALVKPARRLRAGDALRFDDLAATVERDPVEGLARLQFDRCGADFAQALAQTGAMPLPPYIAARRPADEDDRFDYQTVFAREEGSVAAPTAALHFDAILLEALAAAGVLSARLTLHVGAGTFLPVKAEDTEGHRMHAERGVIGAAAASAINAARAAGGRVIAVGTTALRLMETAADEAGRLRPWSGETDIFITPGHSFRAIDGLMTNFHLPRSTLFMLVSAFMGLERLQALYAQAIEDQMRFYSYGDASLLLR